MLKIYGRKTSINVQKVMWAVGELGLAHERLDVGGAFGGLDTPEFGALNPNRLIPTLEDEGAVVWESNAVIRYLAAKYGAGSLWPEDPGARGAADRWMDWQLTTFYPDFITFFLGIVRTPPSKRDEAANAAAAERTGKNLAVVEAQLAKGAFLTGDQLTMGDISVGAMLYRYFTLEIERPSLPRLEAWYATLSERPAYREHVMISYDSLRVTD
jgi:glutathione S-transferase